MTCCRTGHAPLRALFLGAALALAPGFAPADTPIPERAAFEAFAALLAADRIDAGQLALILAADDTARTRIEIARHLLQQDQPDLIPDLLDGLAGALPLDDAARTEALDLLAAAYLRLGRGDDAVGAAIASYDAAVARLGPANPALIARLLELRALVAEFAPDDLTLIEAELADLQSRVERPEMMRMGKPVAVPLWFGTNRNDTGARDPATRFGVELADLTLGQLTVTIPPTHRTGQIEQPRFWGLTRHPDPMQHMVLAGIETLAAAQFSAGCCDTGDRLLFIHGFNVSFHDGALRAAQLAHDLEFPGQALYYSWPSRGALLGYLTDANNVLASRPALVEFLRLASEGGGKLHVIAHSMGNRYFLEAVDELLRIHPDRALGHVILGAPDVDSNELSVRLERLSQHAQSISLYASRNDRALLVSRRIHGAPRAGDSSEGAIRLAGLDTLDASDIVADMLGHSYFGDSPLVLGDLAALLRLGLAPALRCATLERDAPVYDIRPDGCSIEQVLAAIEYHDRYADAAPARLHETLAAADQGAREFWLGVMDVLSASLGPAQAP